MLRKLIMFGITAALGKKLYGNWRAHHLRTPFPTASRPREGRRARMS